MNCSAQRPTLPGYTLVAETGGMATREPAEPESPLPDAESHARRLAGEALASGDPAGWFERLYAAAETGQAAVPWDRGAPHPLLVEWAATAGLDGARGRAVVVGCGLGHDAEYVAALGFDTIAFDVSPSAVRAAQNRVPGSAVEYLTADVLSPPAPWHRAFDMVLESLTLQALPDPPRREAIANVGNLVARGGTLLVIARARDADEDPDEGPPWALTRAEFDAFAATGLEPVRIEEIRDQGPPATHRWRAQFSRR
jgi:SAM-dependent methyltransferase